jgi:hypothetical protein
MAKISDRDGKAKAWNATQPKTLDKKFRAAREQARRRANSWWERLKGWWRGCRS